MLSLRTVLTAIAGLALPVGLALAVYFASAGTIAATPASVDVSAQRIAQPSSPKAEKRETRKERNSDSDSGTTTSDDHGGETEPRDDHGGSSGSDSDNSGSGSLNSGSGSSNSGPGGGDDD
jgi:hypothetical protein